jgi:Putative Ig domain
LLFREDIVKTFSGEILRKLRVLSSLVVGILVWALVFAGCSGSSTIAITLSSTATSVNPGQTATITATLTHDTNNQGVTWTLTGPGQLSGNTTTSVVYTAPPTVATSTTATITATSVANTTITTTQSITLTAVLTITTTSLPSATLGVAYQAFVNAAGAPAPFTWSVKSGTLPAGLTFQTTSTSPSAEITGTPTVLGTSDFTVQVTDSSDASVTQALNITVNRPPPLSVATGSLQNGTVNQTYNQTLQASSGVQPYTWAITVGTLPIGLALNSTTGVISGTPIATETSNFTVEVKDSSTPQQSATASLSITIGQGSTENAKLNGNYAFSVRGFDANGLFVATGSFLADGNGNLSGGVMDVNETGGLPLNETFNGTYSVGQDGLGFMTFDITAGGTGTRAFAFSMTAKGDVNNIIEFDDTGGFANGSARNSGVLLRQDTNAFTTASITGSYAFGFLGVDSGKNRFGVAGDFQADGAGNFTSGLLDSDDASSGLASSVAFTGTYTAIAPSGRGQATIKTAQATTVYSFYVVNSGELLVVGIDPFTLGGNPLVGGTILQQTSGSDFTAPSVFELTALNASTAQDQIGQFQAVTGSFNLTSDENASGTLTQPTGLGTYSITSGRVSLTGTGFQNSLPVLYMVSEDQAFIIGTDSAVSFGFMTPQQAGFSLPGTYAGGSLAPVDPTVSNVVSIVVAGSNAFNLTANVSNGNGLSVSNLIEATTPPDAHGRVVVTENTNTTQILYLVSPEEFFALSAVAATPDVRVDIFQQ